MQMFCKPKTDLGMYILRRNLFSNFEKVEGGVKTSPRNLGWKGSLLKTAQEVV